MSAFPTNFLEEPNLFVKAFSEILIGIRLKTSRIRIAVMNWRPLRWHEVPYMAPRAAGYAVGYRLKKSMERYCSASCTWLILICSAVSRSAMVLEIFKILK